ncbi:unnamed protein product [Polarella glacialis]|uniref:Uncharacterized protein n=1 Tax=Polarella glacialis TaxID=89957 RepID=A0A813FYJ9_POLGL|nr:unnamed protein product [Polarella glacialis]
MMTWGATASMGPRELLDAVDRAGQAGAGLHQERPQQMPRIMSDSSNMSRQSRPRPRAVRVVADDEKRRLWERLSCRCQALLPELTPQELCRALFGFHRARWVDEALLSAACEELLEAESTREEEGSQRDESGSEPQELSSGSEGLRRRLTANDAALLFKALAKHGYRENLPALDLLLRQAGQELDGAVAATPADISQLLSAVVRLGLGSRLGGGQGEESWDDACEWLHPGLLRRLLASARTEVGRDAHMPASDLTNLCVAIASLPPTTEGSLFLVDVAQRLQGRPDRAGAISPRDLVRRLQSFNAFDEGLRRNVCRQPLESEAETVDTISSAPWKVDRSLAVLPVRERLGRESLSQLCRAAALGLARRTSELDPETNVGAVEALAALQAAFLDPELQQEQTPTSNTRKTSSTAGENDATGAQSTDWHPVLLDPLLALLLQRLPSMSQTLLQRTDEARRMLSQHSATADPLSETLLAELSAALARELSSRTPSGG